MGKGPAPRFKGRSVTEERDAALRHLREVLVAYAILTIQNPDMWGDDVSLSVLYMRVFVFIYNV